MTATLHPTAAGLLAAILAEPEDDGLRLIYADWLEENGDEAERAHAALIRRGVQRGEVRREWNIGAALILTGSAALGAKLLGVGGAVVRRGFVAEASLTLADWTQHGPVLVRAAPLERVKLTDKLAVLPGEVSQFMTSAAMVDIDSSVSAALLAWAKAERL